MLLQHTTHTSREHINIVLDRSFTSSVLPTPRQQTQLQTDPTEQLLHQIYNMAEGTTVQQYSNTLRKLLSDAGLQGALQADAFKLLLQYMADEQADPQIMAMLLDQLKQGAQIISCTSKT